MSKRNLGIIAGGGHLPAEIARIYTLNGGQCFIATLDVEVFFNLSDKYNCQNFQVGQVGAIIDFFKESAVDDIILIGGIQRPDFKSIKVDIKGSKLMGRIMKNTLLGDDTVLKIVSNFIEEEGFKVIAPTEILKLTNYDNDLVTVNHPNSQDEKDIEIGKEILSVIGKYDVGQAIIVFNGYVLGIEAAEGTDNLILRSELLRRSKKGGVLVKMSKPNQDMRLDIPTIGPDTILYLANHGFNGVAIEGKGVIIANPEETKNTAQSLGIFISVI